MTRVWPQFLAAFSICLGAWCTGTLIAFLANIGSRLQEGELNDVKFDATDTGWIGSIMCVGAGLVCVPIGYLLNIIGRKLTLLLTVVPFTAGWALLFFTNGLGMSLGARFILGLAGGSFCIGAPLYTMEIAEIKMRGMMGTFFQLFITIGILYSQVMGWVLRIKGFIISCAVIPFVFLVAFILQPESPIYLMKKGKTEKATKALKYLRGSDYDPSDEMKQIQSDLDKEKSMQGKCKETMQTKAAKKATFICFSLMFFQQFTGINAIMFYTGVIFEKADIELQSELQVCIVGIIQVIITVISAVTVDRFGRKLLLLVSTSLMGIGLLGVGVFFAIDEYGDADEGTISILAWIPVIAVCLYIIGFSLGMGPIPWMMAAELVPPEVKPQIAAIAGLLNWTFAFIISVAYMPIKEAIGGTVPFFFFMGMCVLCILFCLFIMPETKGKTLAEIQKELSGE